jgi:hypothetical protein
MGVFSRSFEAVFATQPTMRASVRIGRKQLDRCLCSRFDTTRTNTEEGQLMAVASLIKVLEADLVEAFGNVKLEGQAILFQRPGDVGWKPARIVAVSYPTDGIYSLTLEAEYA